MFTYSDENILAVIGKEEFKKLSMELSDEELKDLVVISIQDPDDGEDLSTYRERFSDNLSVRFWDVIEAKETPNKVLIPITDTVAEYVKRFILKNRDKRFVIHCSAGMSRSAGVAMAVTCLLKHHGIIYRYMLSEDRISNHPRYHPNLKVFDVIMGIKTRFER